MAKNALQMSWVDRALVGIAPKWVLNRVRARTAVQVMARHYEAAQSGRRTEGWRRVSGDANVANGPAIAKLRDLSRDMRRNNGWARRGIQVITNNTIGWGIMPKPKARPSHASGRARAAIELWNDWAESTDCDFDGRLNFYGLQRLAMDTIAEAGEVLILRQPAADDGLAIPFRIQVLEPDYLDASKNWRIEGGGRIIDGVEFDQYGRRTAYWLFTSHPGGKLAPSASVRIPAERVLHVYHVDRPGQVRGIPWLASAMTRLRDLDDFEDAELMRQKVAACFGAFVTETDPAGSALGEQDTSDSHLEHLEPGHIAYLPPGKQITFPSMPNVQDAAFSQRALRLVAVALGVTYEELSGDYSNANFSSARMARLAHWQNVTEWREHMIIPVMCNGVWNWAMDLIAALEGWNDTPAADWAAPPMPILEPDKEGLAYLRLVRIGAMTWNQMVRELGYDPMEQLDEIEAIQKEFDRRGIVLDIDPRKITSAGQVQAPPADNAAQNDTARAAALISTIESAMAALKAVNDRLASTSAAA